MKIAFILVRPEHPGNVGSAARAMKTMGFTDLRLVAPLALPTDTAARQMAHAAEDILDRARVTASLAEAVAGMDLVIGTTVRQRIIRLPLHDAARLPELVKEKGSAVSGVAIVFGPEQAGLSAADVACCDLLSTVPMAVRQPPLNLAQAVMIYAYVLSPLVTCHAAPATVEEAGRDVRLAALKQRVDELLAGAGLAHQKRTRRRIAEGLARMSFADLGLVHLICSKLGGSPADEAGDAE